MEEISCVKNVFCHQEIIKTVLCCLQKSIRKLSNKTLQNTQSRRMLLQENNQCWGITLPGHELFSYNSIPRTLWVSSHANWAGGWAESSRNNSTEYSIEILDCISKNNVSVCFIMWKRKRKRKVKGRRLKETAHPPDRTRRIYNSTDIQYY